MKSPTATSSTARVVTFRLRATRAGARAAASTRRLAVARLLPRIAAVVVVEVVHRAEAILFYFFLCLSKRCHFRVCVRVCVFVCCGESGRRVTLLLVVMMCRWGETAVRVLRCGA